MPNKKPALIVAFILFLLISFFFIKWIYLSRFINNKEKLENNIQSSIKNNPMNNQAPENNSPTKPSMDEKLPTFKKVKLGQSVYVSKTTKIIFRELVSDSRCPKGVQCITAGEAVVRLQLVDDVTDFSKAYISTIKFGAEGVSEQNEMPYLNLLITAMSLSPYPEAGKEINPSNYEVTLKVEQRSIVE